jgi:PAS domain S-box-containing protein
MQTSTVFAEGEVSSQTSLFVLFLLIVLMSLIAHVMRLKQVLKQHQMKVDESERRFEALFKGNQCIELVIDPDHGAIIEANHAAEKFYGYSREQLLSMRITDINIMSEDLVRERLQAVKNEKSDTVHQFKHQLADGSIKRVEAYTEIISWGDKKVIYSVIFDISPRWEAQKRAYQFEQAIEQTGQAVMITDKHGQVEYVNPAYQQLTGYQFEDVKGKVPSILKNQDEAMWKTIQSGESWQGKVRKQKKNGTSYLAMVTVSQVWNKKGEVAHTVVLQMDLSEQERLEQQLQQAQKMEAIGTLVGGIAHDFNNMLAGMVGNLYLARKQAVDQPKLIEKLNNIEQLSYKAAEMISHLLTFARKGHISMQPLCFNDLIKDTTKLFDAVVPENIELTFDICQPKLVVHGDATQLEQVLMNLVSNAQDALEGVENPRIFIHMDKFIPDEAFLKDKPYFKNKAYARLCVQDNGHGIPEDAVNVLFEPFFTTKEQGKGTGLGLAMVFGAIKTHQGYIEVESRPHEGATFCIYLPLTEDHIVVNQEHQHTSLGGHSETLLLVDDESHIIQTGREVLESFGYHVLIAENGVQALTVFEEHAQDIDLVITDVVMPEMGGIQAVERMRTINPKLKAIFCTGYDSTLSLSGQGSLKDEVVIGKPYKIEVLAEMIQEQLSRSD